MLTLRSVATIVNSCRGDSRLDQLTNECGRQASARRQWNGSAAWSTVPGFVATKHPPCSSRQVVGQKISFLSDLSTGSGGSADAAAELPDEKLKDPVRPSLASGQARPVVKPQASVSANALTNMKRPIRYSGGRIRYTGQIDRGAFIAWCESSDGRSVLDPIISTMGFVLFGKARAARRRLWRGLTETARSGLVVAGVQREIDSYLARLDTLVHARDLPCVGIDLHRLVVVPRLFANAIIDRRIETLLKAESAFATLDGCELLRDWFVLNLIDGIAAALVDAQPSLKRPLSAGDEWMIVSVNDQFEWRIPFEGPEWPGHYYLLERTSRTITRTVRKAAADAIARMEISLPSLSRSHRNQILRQAGLSLEQLLARA